MYSVFVTAHVDLHINVMLLEVWKESRFQHAEWNCRSDFHSKEQFLVSGSCCLNPEAFGFFLWGDSIEVGVNDVVKTSWMSRSSVSFLIVIDVFDHVN
jgi:hypothetical protein